MHVPEKTVMDAVNISYLCLFFAIISYSKCRENNHHRRNVKTINIDRVTIVIYYLFIPKRWY